MLKITTARDDGFARVLKLEGKLLADWVGELHEACRRARAASSHVQLDLGGLSFVDVAGTIALRDLLRQGVTITTTSPLVGELLKEN
ncbi:MAG: STAS domain-containing protein [Planctomycetaceae bacterium]